VKEISRINIRLERLVLQLPPSIRRLSRQDAIAKNYLRIRDHAINLHSIFHDRFQATRLCGCLAPHNANLQLARIPADVIGKLRVVRFNVLFLLDTKIQSISVPWAWREMEFEPIEAISHTQPKRPNILDKQLPQVSVLAKVGKRARITSLFRKSETLVNNSQNNTALRVSIIPFPKYATNVNF